MRISMAIAVAVLLLAAVMLVADIGSSALWIAVITVAIAFVVIAGRSGRRPVR